MNILEAEDVVKGLPDQVLFQYAQNPPPQIPQYLAVSEVQRRQEMRQRFQSQQAAQQQPTVKDQILQGGIASAGGPPPGGEQPPMAPPGGAPPMAPPMDGGQPPVMAAAGGMMPYSMAGGRSVPAGTGRFFGGFGPEAVPRGDALSRRYGSENPGVQNFNRDIFGRVKPLPSISDVREFLKNPDADQFSDAIAASIVEQEQVKASQNRGLRAPAGGAVGGGRGGGLPYGGPTSYAGMYESPRKKPTVTVEEIPQPPQGMAVGGLVIPELGSPFESSQQSGYSQASEPPPGMSRDAAIRRARSLMEQGRGMDALVLLRQAGVNPSEVGMYSGGMTPGGIVYMQQGRATPSEQEIREAVSTPPRNRTERQKELARFALSSDQYNPLTSNIYQFLYGAQAAPSAAATPPVTSPATTAAPRPAAAPVRPPAVEAGIPAAGAALTANAPPAAASAPPVAPPMAAAVTPPVTPPAATPPAAPAGFADPTTQAYESLLSRLPQTYEAVNRLMPQAGGINAAELERFKPTQADYINPDAARQREELLASLRAQGEARRKEDMAAAERAMKESEAPIQQASEEARRAAIASTLMRLGAGVAAGKGAEGLASASESVEQIMGRAREQAAAERRASRQEFRAAEREATRAERSVADAAFQMQASNITANESAQRDFVRDQKSFAQWAYGQMRDAGREARQAQGDAIKLSIGITQSIDQAVREALRTRAVSENQYTETFGTVFKDVLKEIKETDWGTDDEGDPIVPTAEQLLEAAGKQTDAVLSKRGIVSPASVITVTSPQDLEAVKSGQRYRGPDGIVRIKP